MASKPPVQCPLCSGELPEDEGLENHLVEEHTKREFARDIASTHEQLDESELSG